MSDASADVPRDGDSVTIIRALGGKRLAKLIHSDRIEDYEGAYRYDLIPYPVSDLNALGRLLARLLRRPDCAVVRGIPIDPGRTRAVRRLAFHCKKTGDAPTMRDASHHWLGLDFDGIPRPPDLPAHDLTGCGAEAIRRLPDAFRRAACIVQATGSHGLKPGCRVRVWYWLDRAITGGEAKRWLKETPVDPSVFRTVQPIYSSAPCFAPGVSDHLPTRMVLLPGAGAVVTPAAGALAPSAPRPTRALPAPNAPAAGGYAFAALRNAVVRVRAAGIGNRHATILDEARGLARFVDGRLLTFSDIVEALTGAGRDIDKPGDEIEAIIAWAMDHPATRPLPAGIAA